MDVGKFGTGCPGSLKLVTWSRCATLAVNCNYAGKYLYL
jgi:hypothetical protein